MPDDDEMYPPPPPLGEGEFIHFEYLFFDPDDAETGFSNHVDISHDRTMAQAKAHKLIADPRVWALHIRRYEQPEQGVHLYDEAHRLPKAQNVAFRERKRADTLQKLLGAAVESNHKLEVGFDDAVESYEIGKAADNAVIAELVRMLESIREMAVRDQRDAVFTEPADIARMTKVNLQALRDSERRKAKERFKTRAHLGEEPDPVPDPQGEIEALRSQLSEARAQARNAIGREEWYANAVHRLRDKFGRDAVEPIVKAARLAHDFNRLTPEQQEKAKEDGYVPESAPEDGTGAPEDICVCEHPRKRHVDEGPEHGCHGCPRDEYDHSFKLAVL
jgi:Rad3-related DNA helicase